MLSPTNLPIILWPLTLSVNRPVGFVCENRTWSAVCVTLRSVPRWKSLKPSGPPIWMLVWWLADRISVCMNRCARWSGRWVHGQLSDLHYVSAICRHHVGSEGNVIQQGHEFTTVAAWGPCLAAVIGVTHSKSDRFFLFIFFSCIGQRNELTHTKEIDCSHPAATQHHSSLTPSLHSAHLSTQTDTLLMWSRQSKATLVSILHKDQIKWANAHTARPLSS